jgi:hypothetical protein
VCFSAWETFLVCLNQLPCGNIVDAVGCEQELQDFQANCEGPGP